MLSLISFSRYSKLWVFLNAAFILSHKFLVCYAFIFYCLTLLFLDHYLLHVCYPMESVILVFCGDFIAYWGWILVVAFFQFWENFGDYVFKCCHLLCPVCLLGLLLLFLFLTCILHFLFVLYVWLPVLPVIDCVFSLSVQTLYFRDISNAHC